MAGKSEELASRRIQPWTNQASKGRDTGSGGVFFAMRLSLPGRRGGMELFDSIVSVSSKVRPTKCIRKDSPRVRAQGFTMSALRALARARSRISPEFAPSPRGLQPGLYDVGPHGPWGFVQFALKLFCWRTHRFWRNSFCGCYLRRRWWIGAADERGTGRRICIVGAAFARSKLQVQARPGLD